MLLLAFVHIYQSVPGTDWRDTSAPAPAARPALAAGPSLPARLSVNAWVTGQWSGLNETPDRPNIDTTMAFGAGQPSWDDRGRGRGGRERRRATAGAEGAN